MIAAGEMEPVVSKAQLRQKKRIADHLEQLNRLEQIPEARPEDE